MILALLFSLWWAIGIAVLLLDGLFYMPGGYWTVLSIIGGLNGPLNLIIVFVMANDDVFDNIRKGRHPLSMRNYYR